ncbi:MAG: hypothetical protein AAF694_27470 [Bacteroidota bacterium]
MNSLKPLPHFSFFLFGLYFFSYQIGWSQDSTFSQFESLEWEVGYFGEFATHPGLKAGISYPFGHKLKVREKEKKYGGPFQIYKKRQWIVGSNLAFYHQPNNHNGYLATIELGKRRIKNKSYYRNRYTFWAWELGFGYYRYQLLGNTFRPSAIGFEKIRGNGTAIIPSLSCQWGRSLKSKKAHPGFIYIKFHSLYEVPFGTGFQLRLALESGVIYSFSQDTVSPIQP